jgi:hypothetical protein
VKQTIKHCGNIARDIHGNEENAGIRSSMDDYEPEEDGSSNYTGAPGWKNR